MLEYAISRLMLVWTMAMRLPTVIVTNASTPNTLSRRAVLPPSEWTEHLMDYLG